MSEEITVIKQQDGLLGRIQKNESLLSIIHDKNKIIEKLQRQLHFQKLQLKYYLGKTFRNQKMLEFSNSCNPLLMEENIPITLAVNRFNMQAGIKSKIFVLYERMSRIDGRINNLLHIQECLLRRVVEKMCDIVRKDKGWTMQIQIRSFITKPEYINLFNNLLNASIGLRKNLETFRICCDRLLIIEEERNTVAEQVYSLPIEQRTNCHYLIGIQIEKVQLQNRLKDILKDQNMLRKRIEKLNEIERELRNLQAEYKTANRNCTDHMTDMLRRVNFEALGLIAKSNQQREKYTKEIVKLKCDNQKILRMVEQLKGLVREKALSRDSMKLDTVFSAGLYQALDQEINQAIQDNEMNKDIRIEKIRNECRVLSQKLQNAKNENCLLERELENVKNEYSEARRQWESDLETAQREKDDYKAQVEDLQAIRAAYAQLVDSRANVTEDGERVMAGQNTKELERENLRLSKEVALLKEETKKQKSKIRRLSEQILNINGTTQKILDIDQLETKDVGSGDVGNEKDSLLPKTNSCNICAKKSDLEPGILHQELQRSGASREDVQKSKKLDEITTTIIQDLNNSSNECQSSTLSSSPLESSSDNHDSNYSTESKIISTPEKSIISIGGINFEVPNKNVETTFQIHSSRQEDKDTIQGILEKKDKVGEILRIGDKSLVSVRVRYISTNKNHSRIEDKERTNALEVLKDPPEDSVNCGRIAPLKPAIQLKAIDDIRSLSKNDEVKALKVTYRNPHDYRSTTDSDPATESQSSEVDNYGKMYVQEVKMKLKAMTEQKEQELRCPLVKYGIEGRVKSLGNLR
ncbi:golgin subfamily A member 4-like [Coccinella septempunctata]|uniref:golgin subfamily A member 4-like n=1 Tax=Coccinella septempunctata TaxID=41139 RepID=UPI001D06BE16|nr:golgin subfamily A member 4-like [Coccinella septempunctata]